MIFEEIVRTIQEKGGVVTLTNRAYEDIRFDLFNFSEIRAYKDTMRNCWILYKDTLNLTNQ